MSVVKALIPIAGRGTRLLPVTGAVPKALFPLVDADDRIRAVVHVIVAEALSAGAEQVGIIASPGQPEMLHRYFRAADAAEGSDLSARIEYLLQSEPAGFGDAVARGRAFVDGGPVLVMLGDHVHVGSPGRPGCAAQTVAEFDRHGPVAMIGMQDVGPDQLHLVGVGAGEPITERVYRCTDFVEKPDPATARDRLTTPGMPPDRFLAHAGIFAVAWEIFDCLAELEAHGRTTRGEIQFADALSVLLGRHPDGYYLYRIDGRAYDTGTPACYAAAQAAFRRGPGQA